MRRAALAFSALLLIAVFVFKVFKIIKKIRGEGK